MSSLQSSNNIGEKNAWIIRAQFSTKKRIGVYSLVCQTTRLTRNIFSASAQNIVSSRKPNLLIFFFWLMENMRTPCPGSQNQQGRSQSHSSGWARFPLSLFSPQISITFSYFPHFVLLFFLILALRVGDSPARKGPGYATENQEHGRILPQQPAITRKEEGSFRSALHRSDERWAIWCHI